MEDSNSSHRLVLARLFRWIPSHVGTEGNKWADTVAKAVASSGRPAVDIQPHVNAAFHSFWQDMWDAVGVNELCDVQQRLGVWSYCGLSHK